MTIGETVKLLLESRKYTDMDEETQQEFQTRFWPMYAQYYEALASFPPYQGLMEDISREIRNITPNLPQGDRIGNYILDIGIGPAFMEQWFNESNLFDDNNFAIVGTDNTPAFLDRADTRLGKLGLDYVLRTSDLTKIGRESNSTELLGEYTRKESQEGLFNRLKDTVPPLVVSNNVLYFMPNAEELIRQIYNLLPDGGYLVMGNLTGKVNPGPIFKKMIKDEYDNGSNQIDGAIRVGKALYQQRDMIMVGILNQVIDRMLGVPTYWEKDRTRTKLEDAGFTDIQTVDTYKQPDGRYLGCIAIARK